jgi:protein TonB
MPRDLFGDVTRPSISVGSRKWYTLPLSLFSHSAIVLALIAIPILAPAVMPSVFANDDIAYIKIDMPKPPPAPRLEAVKPPENPYAAPTEPPDGITPEPATPPEIIDAPIPGVVGGSITDTKELAPLPPVVIKNDPPPPVRVGGTVRTPIKTYNVDPAYPAIARQAGIQGIVIIEATISEDGRVINARVLRSVPLLDKEALEAVRQWQYTPTYLNGVPVPVIMTVTVNFTLSR